jgi:hypothetical protein
MKHCVAILSAVAALILSTKSISAQSKAAAGFEKLKALAGEWHGKGPDGQPVKVTYQVASGGSALIEKREPAQEPDMISVFHIDGDKLMMAHYCSAGNQPRMRAEAPAGEIKNLNFTFVDVTNLTKPTAGHMRQLSFTFQDNDHMIQVWTWREDGKDMPAMFELERKK